MNIILQKHLDFDMIESPDGSLGLASLVVHTSSSGIILCHWPNFVGLRHPHAQPYLWENYVGLGLGAEHEASPATSWAA